MPLVETGPFVAGGDCIVRTKGDKTMFVRDALPGERVEVSVTADKKTMRRAQVQEVITPSSARTYPPCPMFRVGCGGCQWQHIEPDSQLAFKVGVVSDSLRRIGRVESIEPRSAGSVSNFGYRTSMRVAVVDGRAALFQRESSNAIPLDICLVAHAGIAELIEDAHFGDNTEVLLRVSATTGARYASGDCAKVMQLPPDVATGDGWMEEDVAGRRFRVSTHSFFQSGHEAAELLCAAVDAVVDDDAGNVVDAYSGVGLLGVTVASRRDATLVAIESSQSACEDLSMNVRDLDAAIVRSEVAEIEAFGTAPDVVIADPARPGLGPSATRALADLEAPQFVLVSCDPASMARDVTLLAAHGYELQGVDVLDLFPHTHHVETVSTFRHR